MLKKKPKQPSELFHAADEPKRQRLRELGWVRVDIGPVGGVWWHEPGKTDLYSEDEAFAWLERWERESAV